MLGASDCELLWEVTTTAKTEGKIRLRYAASVMICMIWPAEQMGGEKH